jgi:hypothetical protein
MPRYMRFVVLLVFAWLLSVSFASADIIQTLTIAINTDCPPATCIFFTGDMGSPASGSGDFTPIGDPWTYQFQTGNALSWCENTCGGGLLYQATFGYGGSVQMTGPDGLTFTGVVTQGGVAVSGFMVGVDVDYFGQWSNGLYGYGTIETMTDPPFDFLVEQFTANVAPEPSSLMLLGTGVASLWSLGRRLRR